MLGLLNRRCILAEIKSFLLLSNVTNVTVYIDKRIKDKCDEKADVWTDNVLERLAYLTVRATDIHAASAYYHKVKDGSSADDLSQVILGKRNIK